MHEAGFYGCRYCGKLLAIARPDYRSPEHNRATGGATRSKHMEAPRLDIMSNLDPAAFEAAARETGFLGFGFYPRSDFKHIDLGPNRKRGERFRRGRPPSRLKHRWPNDPSDDRGSKDGTAGAATVVATGFVQENRAEESALLRRLQVAELEQEEQIVGDL